MLTPDNETLSQTNNDLNNTSVQWEGTMPSIYRFSSDLFHNKIILNLCARFNHYFIITLAFILSLFLALVFWVPFSLNGASSTLTGSYALTGDLLLFSEVVSFRVQWSLYLHLLQKGL